MDKNSTNKEMMEQVILGVGSLNDALKARNEVDSLHIQHLTNEGNRNDDYITSSKILDWTERYYRENEK